MNIGPWSVYEKPKSPWDVQEGGHHYKVLAIQPTRFIYENKLGFIEGNIIKYVCRDKGDRISDLKKAKHYLEILIFEEAKRAGLRREGVGCDTEGDVQESGEAFYKPERVLHKRELVSRGDLERRGTNSVPDLVSGVSTKDIETTKEKSRDGSLVDSMARGVAGSYQEYIRGNCNSFKY